MQRPYTSAAPYTHAYNHGWSPPTHSNESTNGYFLERSNSANKTLERAFELCPDDEQEGQEVEEPSEECVEESVRYTFNKQSSIQVIKLKRSLMTEETAEP